MSFSVKAFNFQTKISQLIQLSINSCFRSKYNLNQCFKRLYIILRKTFRIYIYIYIYIYSDCNFITKEAHFYNVQL